MSYGTEGGTIFRVPDLRGMFLRGVDAGAGNDPDVATRTVNGNGETDAPGSIQADAFQGHWHKFEKRLLGRFGSSDRVETDNNNGDYLNNTRDPISDGVNGESRTSSETRPKNVYVNYIIKY
jgi:hypothetical protein